MKPTIILNADTLELCVSHDTVAEIFPDIEKQSEGLVIYDLNTFYTYLKDHNQKELQTYVAQYATCMIKMFTLWEEEDMKQIISLYEQNPIEDKDAEVFILMTKQTQTILSRHKIHQTMETVIDVNDNIPPKDLTELERNTDKILNDLNLTRTSFAFYSAIANFCLFSF